MITLRFGTSKGIGSFLIRWRTWSDYSHVDFVLPDGTLLGAQGDGVKIRPSDYGKFIKTEFFDIDIDEVTSQRILDFANSQIGKPYDWKAIIGFAFRRDWMETDSWFCSELIEAAFEKNGALLIRTEHLNRIAPSDLLLSPYLKSKTQAQTQHETNHPNAPHLVMHGLRRPTRGTGTSKPNRHRAGNAVQG